MWYTMEMIGFFVFLFGLMVGSFLNALVLRFEKGESAFKGRSYCPQCNHVLAWYDLFPLVSFLLLLGKCRYCKKRISLQYPLVELATGVLFVLGFYYQAAFFSLFSMIHLESALYLWVMLSILVAIFVYDLRNLIIPDVFVYSAIGGTFLWYILWLVMGVPLASILSMAYSALGAAAFFLAIFLISKGAWMGFGDVKLAFFMGLFLGFPKITVALLLAFFIGALVGIGLMLAKKKGLKSEVPFGPFLIAGTIVAFFWGNMILNWYLNLSLV